MPVRQTVQWRVCLLILANAMGHHWTKYLGANLGTVKCLLQDLRFLNVHVPIWGIHNNSCNRSQPSHRKFCGVVLAKPSVSSSRRTMPIFLLSYSLAAVEQAQKRHSKPKSSKLSFLTVVNEGTKTSVMYDNAFCCAKDEHHVCPGSRTYSTSLIAAHRTSLL